MSFRMRFVCLVLLTFCGQFGSNFVYDDEDFGIKNETDGSEAKNEKNFVTILVNHTYMPIFRNINCEQIIEYSQTCSMEANKIYNTTNKIPPHSDDMNSWCGSVKFMIDCAMDWNLDCSNVTESRFSDENIEGHKYIYKNLCQNRTFLSSYKNVSDCIRSSARDWEQCYEEFEMSTSQQKSGTLHWTHYETHFYLCCTRAMFRKCTLNALLKHCSKDQVFLLQKYSVAISAGDVFQDCEKNMMYENCPGGDPRASLQTIEAFARAIPNASKSINILNMHLFCLYLLVYKIVLE